MNNDAAPGINGVPVRQTRRSTALLLMPFQRDDDLLTDEKRVMIQEVGSMLRSSLTVSSHGVRSSRQ